MGLRADARAPHAAQALTSSSRPSWRRQRPEPRQPRLPPLLRQLLLPARTLLQLRHAADAPRQPTDRKRVVEGKGVFVRVDLGGRRLIKKEIIQFVPDR